MDEAAYEAGQYDEDDDEVPAQPQNVGGELLERLQLDGRALRQSASGFGRHVAGMVMGNHHEGHNIGRGGHAALAGVNAFLMAGDVLDVPYAAAQAIRQGGEGAMNLFRGNRRRPVIGEPVFIGGAYEAPQVPPGQPIVNAAPQVVRPQAPPLPPQAQQMIQVPPPVPQMPPAPIPPAIPAVADPFANLPPAPPAPDPFANLPPAPEPPAQVVHGRVEEPEEGNAAPVQPEAQEGLLARIKNVVFPQNSDNFMYQSISPMMIMQAKHHEQNLRAQSRIAYRNFKQTSKNAAFQQFAAKRRSI
jgi:hypothetical protein